MPQNSFRLPSASELDRHQSNPAASDTTPKVAFKWKRDGKLSKDISCYLSGETVPGKKSKEPDIPVAMYKDGKMLTIYQPNMGRVEVEDTKGLEVVFLLSAAVIKDIFFNPNREMFNINSPNTASASKRKNSGPVINTGKASVPVMSGAVMSPVTSAGRAPTSRIPSSQAAPQKMYAASNQQQSRPPPPPTQNQQQIDAETARLKVLVEREAKERERADREEQKRIKKMLEAEEKERKRREAEVAKETERLRKQYGVTSQEPPRVNVNPPMPPRPQQQPGYQPQQYPQFHNVQRPTPAPRPLSTPSGPPPGSSSPPNASLNTWLQRPHKSSGSSGGFLGLGGKKLEKKRSVFF